MNGRIEYGCAMAPDIPASAVPIPKAKAALNSRRSREINFGFAIDVVRAAGRAVHSGLFRSEESVMGG